MNISHPFYVDLVDSIEFIQRYSINEPTKSTIHLYIYFVYIYIDYCGSYCNYFSLHNKYTGIVDLVAEVHLLNIVEIYIHIYINSLFFYSFLKIS